MWRNVFQFETKSAEVGSDTPEKLDFYYFRFGYVLFPVNFLLKQKRAMRREMRKPHCLKVIFYIDRMIDHSEYLAVLPG